MGRSCLASLSRQSDCGCELGHASMPAVSWYALHRRQHAGFMHDVPQSTGWARELRDVSWFCKSGAPSRSSWQHCAQRTRGWCAPSACRRYVAFSAHVLPSVPHGARGDLRSDAYRPDTECGGRHDRACSYQNQRAEHHNVQSDTSLVRNRTRHTMPIRSRVHPPTATAISRMATRTSCLRGRIRRERPWHAARATGM